MVNLDIQKPGRTGPDNLPSRLPDEPFQGIISETHGSTLLGYQQLAGRAGATYKRGHCACLTCTTEPYRLGKNVAVKAGQDRLDKYLHGATAYQAFLGLFPAG